jgi:ComF family protein
MKYRDMHRIARWFGIVLGERIIDSNFIKGNPVLVPVPLHKLRKIERSYNQADYICKGISWETGLECIPDALIRVRYTESQAGSQFNKPQRRENVLNAFSVNAKHLPILLDRPVILVDDLITTGATISECAIALEESGVRDIRFLAIARPPEKQWTMDN